MGSSGEDILPDPFCPRFVRITFALTLSFAVAQPCFAQTDTEEPEMQRDHETLSEITVFGKSSLAGSALNSNEPKGRSEATRALIATKSPTSSVPQLIENLPGVNSSSDDSTGLFNSTITIRGFAANQIGWTLDGVPLNAAVNYNVFPQQYCDAENINSIVVNQGAADASSPTPNASGGTISISYREPSEDRGAVVNQTVGSNSLARTFARVDTGRTESGVAAFGSISYSHANKFRGRGSANRWHTDLKADWADASNVKVSVLFAYTDQMNSFFKPVTLAQFNEHGRDFDYADILVRPMGGPGAQNESSVADYYRLQVNPFKQGTATVKADVNVATNVLLTVQPYYFFGTGGGGNGFLVRETDPRLGTNGEDLNGDRDTLDTVAVYRITRGPQTRPGVKATVSYQLPNTLVSAGYDWERAHDFQERPYITVDADGNPTDVWGTSGFVTRVNGNILKDRDRTTISTFNQAFIQVDNVITSGIRLQGGLRAPTLTRDTVNNLVEVDTPSLQKHNETTYRGLLPSAGVSWTNSAGLAWASAAKTFRAPDNTTLFDVNRDHDLAPERAWAYEAGYRYSRGPLFVAATAFAVNFSDRQLSALGPDQQTTVVTNVGSTQVRGAQLEVATASGSAFNFYGSVTYTRAKLAGSLPAVTNVDLNLNGKEVPATPRWLTSVVATYNRGMISASVQVRFTGSQYATLVNDEKVPGYTLVDLGCAFDLDVPEGRGLHAKLVGTITNVFNTRYLTNVNFTNNANSIGPLSGTSPTYSVGSPRTFAATIALNF